MNLILHFSHRTLQFFRRVAYHVDVDMLSHPSYSKSQIPPNTAMVCTESREPCKCSEAIERETEVLEDLSIRTATSFSYIAVVSSII
jgi:hypothetical protein